MSKNKPAPKQYGLGKLIAVLVIAFIIYSLATREVAVTSAPPSVTASVPLGNAVSTPKQKQQIVAHFQSNKEPKAKDAVWTSNDMFKVGMINDGTSRNGYANYVCETLYDFGFKGQRIRVQIVDIIKLTKNNKWVKLGEARCK